MRGRGRPLGVWRQRSEQLAATAAQALERCGVLGHRTIHLQRKRLVTTGAQPGCVLLVGMAAYALDELRKAICQTWGFELVAEHGREREGQWRALVEQIQQWQIAAGHRLPQPLLTKWP